MLNSVIKVLLWGYRCGGIRQGSLKKADLQHKVED